MIFDVEVDWTYGVNPILVDYIDGLDVPVERIKVISENEIIITNNPA